MFTNNFFHLILFPLLYAVANLYGFSFMILYNVCTFDIKFDLDMSVWRRGVGVVMGRLSICLSLRKLFNPGFLELLHTQISYF
jgi:hypothetical protein